MAWENKAGNQCYKKLNNFSFICLNLEIVTNTYFSYYPISNLNAFSKAFIKEIFNEFDGDI